jgi:hypothetical protein
MGVLDSLRRGGVDWSVELERDGLLPGQAARGRVRFTVEHQIEARGLQAALVATEQWQYHETVSDGHGGSHTVTKTGSDELVREPVNLLGPTVFEAGHGATIDFSVPVPALGPATFEGSVTSLAWAFEIRMDVPGLDHSVSRPVRVLQPTALLRAGVIDLPEYALWPSCEAADGELKAALAVEPVPLYCGASFRGNVSAESGRPVDLQEIRAELRVDARATVGNGLSEQIVLWRGRVRGPGRYEGGQDSWPFEGALPAQFVPTVRLPHGAADAKLEITFARPLALDNHLTRDVALSSTTEL